MGGGFEDLDGFYDDPASVGQYLRHRHGGVSSPNVVMEEPALWQALGAVEGLRVADLGCGDAAIAPRLLAAGAISYHGIDASELMVSAAQTSCAGLQSVTIEQLAIEAFTPSPASLDLIITRLALHYVSNLETVLTTCADALVAGGRLVLSVVHPLITANDAAVPGQPRTSWPVDNYFEPGPRRRQWFDSTVTWQHRTIETYVTALLHAGFTLTALNECAPAADLLAGNQAELARRRRVPLFLLLAGHRH